jgi:hypothetical protein
VCVCGIWYLVFGKECKVELRLLDLGAGISACRLAVHVGHSRYLEVPYPSLPTLVLAIIRVLGMLTWLAVDEGELGSGQPCSAARSVLSAEIDQQETAGYWPKVLRRSLQLEYLTAHHVVQGVAGTDRRSEALSAVCTPPGLYDN